MYILETQYDESNLDLIVTACKSTNNNRRHMYTFAFAHDLKNMNVTTNLKRKEI